MTQPCYCVALRGAARKITALYDSALAPTGVTVAQFSLLRRIEQAGSPSLTELARLADLDRSTVGRNVKLLERVRLVRITPGTDQREATVTLADPGFGVLQAGAPLWDAVQRRIEASLGPAGVTQLLEALQSL